MNVRNTDGIWINSNVFKEAGTHYLKHGYYCSEPYGTAEWLAFWQEERNRCINGYQVGGSKITGEHYFYLNYCPIQKVSDTNSKKSVKIIGFPDFWDGDYNYFWVREIAKNGLKSKGVFNSLYLDVKIPEIYLDGGYNLIVGKARRRGYSYKNACVAVRNYFTTPYSLSIFNASDKKYLFPKGIMSMAQGYINFVNANTGWVMPSDMVNKQDHIRSSYIEYRNGIKYEKGFKSEIIALSCSDNPDVNRGKDALDIIIEEAGAFGTPGLLKQLYASSQDCVMAGAIKTGMITIFGTSGDMTSGTVDYADMFSRPEAFGLLPFENTWDERPSEAKVGFFHPINWNMEGFYDEQGNSDKQGAKELELEIRKSLISNGATTNELGQRLQEKPLNPAEAFSVSSINNFPVAELKRQLEKVKANKLQEIKGTPVKLMYEGRKVTATPILNRSVTPITSYYNIPNDKRGCPIIYEYPVEPTPRGLYKIGYDPIDQEAGSSLAGICVYKGVHTGTAYHSILVAEYIGRYEDPDDIDKTAEMFAVLYNTTIMHENMVTGVKNYFRRIKRLDLLAYQPDNVISKNIKQSKVARVYGCHMNRQLKDAGERYVKTWLLTILDYDEFENPILVIDRIYSKRLLEELISYNRKGNFDLVSALFMCMFQVQEEELNKDYDDVRENKNITKLLSMIDDMYKK